MYQLQKTLDKPDIHITGFQKELSKRVNSVVEILANTTSQKWNGSVTVRTG